VQDVIELAGHLERVRNIAADEFELGVAEQVSDVFGCARDEVIDGNHLVPFREESVAEVRPNEPRPASNQCAHEMFLPWVFGGDGVWDTDSTPRSKSALSKPQPQEPGRYPDLIPKRLVIRMMSSRGRNRKVEDRPVITNYEFVYN
jgi:hypothetical protein